MSLTRARHAELKRYAIQLRRLVVESVHHAGAGHLGGPMSAAELLIALYFAELNIDPARPRDENRDRFILSKGHSSIGLYAALALRGYLPIEELATFDAIDSRLQGHPDMSVLPGLDMSTGSLGQGLSPGLGMALAARLKGQDFRTWVMIGDGDSQEGQIWEAAFVAARYGLDNLTAILDWNGLQQYGWATEKATAYSTAWPRRKTHSAAGAPLAGTPSRPTATTFPLFSRPLPRPRHTADNPPSSSPARSRAKESPTWKTTSTGTPSQ